MAEEKEKIEGCMQKNEKQPLKIINAVKSLTE